MRTVTAQYNVVSVCVVEVWYIRTLLAYTPTEQQCTCTPYLEDQQNNWRVVWTENEAGENRGLLMCETRQMHVGDTTDAQGQHDRITRPTT